MQKSIIVERSSSSLSSALDVLNKYLSEGWIVEKMTPFHPAVSVSATHNTYSSLKATDHGAVLVILDDLGIEATQ